MKGSVAFVDRWILFLVCVLALFAALPAHGQQVPGSSTFTTLRGRTIQAGAPATAPARLELWNNLWTGVAISKINASAFSTGADPSVQIQNALNSSLCTTGCWMDDGVPVSSGSTQVPWSQVLSIGTNQVVVLHGHYYFSGAQPSTGLVNLTGFGAGISCEPNAVVQTKTFPSSWQGTAGLDSQASSGSGPIVTIGDEGQTVHGCTIRGDQYVTSLVQANNNMEFSNLTVDGNILRGTYFGGYQTTSYAVDLSPTTLGIGDNSRIGPNVMYWTTGGVRINPANSAGSVEVAHNWLYYSYGPAFTFGPGYLFDLTVRNNGCVSNLTSTANEVLWDFNNTDTFVATNNHNECYDVSGAGGVIQARVMSGQAGILQGNTWAGNQSDTVAAHDPKYSVYLQSTSNLVIQGDLLAGSSASGIHFGTGVTGITHSSNKFKRGHAGTTTYTDGLPGAIYSAQATQVGPGTGSPTGWGDLCNACPSVAMTANKLFLIGKYIPYPVSFSRLCAGIGVADATNNSDLCLYDAGGNLVADTGAVHMSATGFQCFNAVQSAPIVIPPGLYFYGATSAAATLAVNATGIDVQPSYSYSTGYGTSSGGTCPSTITPPPNSPVLAGSQFALM